MYKNNFNTFLKVVVIVFSVFKNGFNGVKTGNSPLSNALKMYYF